MFLNDSISGSGSSSGSGSGNGRGSGGDAKDSIRDGGAADTSRAPASGGGATILNTEDRINILVAAGGAPEEAGLVGALCRLLRQDLGVSVSVGAHPTDPQCRPVL